MRRAGDAGSASGSMGDTQPLGTADAPLHGNAPAGGLFHSARWRRAVAVLVPHRTISDEQTR